MIFSLYFSGFLGPYPSLPSFRSLPSYLPSTASKPIRFFDFYTREAVDEGRKGTKEGNKRRERAPSTHKILKFLILF